MTCRPCRGSTAAVMQESACKSWHFASEAARGGWSWQLGRQDGNGLQNLRQGRGGLHNLHQGQHVAAGQGGVGCSYQSWLQVPVQA